MKTKVLLAPILISLLAFTGRNPHTETYRVDPNQSTLEWNAAKVTGKHNGTIKIESGEVLNDHGQLRGTFVIDMTTIANTDLEAGESRSKLEGHLKSPDFFDVQKFPKSTFTITSFTPLTAAKDGGYTHNVKGNLTIKDKTNEISFDVIMKNEGTKLLCNGTAVVDRSKFDVRYGSKTFFDNIGDKAIYDEFTMKFGIVADKK